MSLLTNEKFALLHAISIVVHYSFRFVLFGLMYANLITL